MSLIKNNAANPEIDDAASQDDGASSLSLMGGVAKPEGLPAVDFDLDAMKASRQKISQGTLILLLVAAIAGGTLYAMRLSQGELNANAVSTEVMKKIETALARTTAGVTPGATSGGTAQVTPVRSTFRDTESIVKVFNADVSKSQVPIEYVQRNPFALAVETTVEATPGKPSTTDAVRLRELQKKLESEFNGLKLQSVMASARIPVVVIDGQFYKEGQQVGSFTITRIHDRGVDLQAEGLTMTLSMQDQPRANQPGRRR